MAFSCSSSPIGSRPDASDFDLGLPNKDSGPANDTANSVVIQPDAGPIHVEAGESQFAYVGCAGLFGPEREMGLDYYWEIVGPSGSLNVSRFNDGLATSNACNFSEPVNRMTPTCFTPDIPGDYTLTLTVSREGDPQSVSDEILLFAPPVFQASLIWLPAGSFGISNLDFHYRQAGAEWESEDGDISWHNMDNSPDWGAPRPIPGEPCHAALSCGCNERGWLDDPYYPVDAFNQDMSQEWIIHPLPAAGVYELGVANIAIDSEGQYLQEEPIIACLRASWLGEAIYLLEESPEVCFAIPPQQDAGIVTVGTLRVLNGIQDRWATNDFTIHEEFLLPE